jgi:hypothetical protein
MGNGWHENERRLFVWFVICFVQFKVIDAAKFVDGFEKYWRKISELFWQKDVHLLKYQFLNLIKTKGRAAWKKEEEELLKVAFRYQLGYIGSIIRASGMKLPRSSIACLTGGTSRPPSSAGSGGIITSTAISSRVNGANRRI